MRPPHRSEWLEFWNSIRYGSERMAARAPKQTSDKSASRAMTADRPLSLSAGQLSTVRICVMPISGRPDFGTSISLPPICKTPASTAPTSAGLSLPAAIYAAQISAARICRRQIFGAQTSTAQSSTEPISAAPISPVQNASSKRNWLLHAPTSKPDCLCLKTVRIEFAP
jgi:hypothetical protein